VIKSRALVVFASFAFFGCTRSPTAITLSDCWNSEQLRLSNGQRVAIPNALIFYSSDGPLSAHPRACEGKPLWIKVSDRVFASMEQSGGNADWHCGKFFSADIAGVAAPDIAAPGGVAIEVTELHHLRRSDTPDRLKQSD
jgi:hypothetical protein